MSIHEVLREGLAPFEPGGGLCGPKEESALGRETIGNAKAQRYLRSNYCEVGALACRKDEQTRRIREVSFYGAGKSRHPGIPGRADDLDWVALGGQPSSQRVLARTAADH
jgi:hypothetical protein